MSDAYGELFEHNNAGTALALGAAGAFAQWVLTTVSFAGPTDLLVPSAATHNLIVGVNGAGLYFVNISVTFGSNKPGSMTECSLFVNGVENLSIGFHRTIGNAGDQGAAPADGFVQLAVGDIADLRFNSSVMNTTLQLFHCTLSIRSYIRDQ